jgi:hypothetical protein
MDDQIPAQETGFRTNIVSFDVIGVFVDSYRPYFSYAGGTNGAASIEMEQNKVGEPGSTWDGLATKGPWNAVTAPDPGSRPVAVPTHNSIVNPVWSYYVPAGNVARLIIALENIEYEESFDGGVTFDSTIKEIDGIKYLTVDSYVVPSLHPTNTITQMLRGYIYQISAAQMTFNTSHLWDTPNPVNVTLTVTVDIQNWILASTNVNLR